jgi:GTP-binding protein
MSQYPEARFIKSANALSQFVPDDGSEVAVAGRSNSGKSSAINVIVNRRQFARTSKTPGRTQLVNFFSLEEGRRLVDLPGYGFARVSDSMRRHWGELLSQYFKSRESLNGLLLIVDIRRKLTDYDRQMMAFTDEAQLPIHILLTKADKLKRGQVATAVLQVKKEVGDRATVQPFSALNRQGEDEARAMLEKFLHAESTK